MTTLERRRAMQNAVGEIDRYNLSERAATKNKNPKYHLKAHVKKMSASTNGRSDKYCEIYNEIEELKAKDGTKEAITLKSQNPGSALALLENKGICK